MNLRSQSSPSSSNRWRAYFGNLFTEATPSNQSACYSNTVDYADRGISAFISNDSIAAGRSIDRGSIRPWIGSRRYVGEISLEVGVLHVAGRHAIYKLSVFDSAAARSRRDDSAQWKRNTTRSFRASHFPARMHVPGHQRDGVHVWLMIIAEPTI